MFNMRAVQPTRLDNDSKFKFLCHPGVSCFTRCCSNIDIFLTPYDVLRLKKRLGMHSSEFLEKYAGMRIDEKSSHPYAYLKMSQDEHRVCPFLKNKTEGCGVYEDRPVACRYYPVGQTTLKSAPMKEGDEPQHEEFYFFVKEEHCKGFDEAHEWTIDAWRDDQGAEHFDAMNRQWKELLMRRNIPGQPPLNEKKQFMFFLASYDLDGFRSFLFQSGFLEKFQVSDEEIAAIEKDDVELMNFAVRFLKYLMMMEQAFVPREGVVDEFKAKKKPAEEDL